MVETERTAQPHLEQTVLSGGKTPDSVSAFISDEELLSIEQRMPKKSKKCLGWVNVTFPDHRLTKTIYKMMLLCMISDERWKDFQQVILSEGVQPVIGRMIEDAAVNIWNGVDPNK